MPPSKENDHTAVGALGAEGADQLPGDFDSDGDVDLADVAAFQTCFRVIDLRAISHCPAGDRNQDASVDLTDYSAMYSAINGP